MNGTELYFLEKVREFKRMELEFIKYTYETKTPDNKKESEQFMKRAIELAFEAIELRNVILGEMHDVSDIQIIDPEAKMTLDKLRNHERFESLTFAYNLASVLNRKIDKEWDKIKLDLQHYFSFDKYDEIWDDFFSWFYIPEYYYRKAHIGAIITSSKLPKNIIQYFEEIKEAFAFGLDKSCISLSRALLEIALHNKLKTKGLFKPSKRNIIDIAEEDPLNRLIVVSYKKKLLTEELKKLAMEIKEKGNNVLHIKDAQGMSVRGIAIKTIKDTVKVIEYLYG